MNFKLNLDFIAEFRVRISRLHMYVGVDTETCCEVMRLL